MYLSASDHQVSKMHDVLMPLPRCLGRGNMGTEDERKVGKTVLIYYGQHRYKSIARSLMIGIDTP